MQPRRTEYLRVDDIEVINRLRSISAEAVDKVARSMAEIGLRTPITIRVVDEMEVDGEVVEGVPVLVTGATRLAAAAKLGWEKIECFVADCDEIDAKLWEISENLHRAELTALERGEQIAEWDRLQKLRQPDGVSGGRGKKGGTSETARHLGVSEPDVRRAVKVASLSPEAKHAARDVGLDNNRSALLEAAKHSTPEAQVTALQTRTASAFPKDPAELSVEWRRKFERVWNDAPSPDDREWARQWIDKPIMDARYGAGEAA